MNPDLPMERPLTRRECHDGLNRQEFLKWGNLFKKIASDLDNDDHRHLTLGDFPVSESKINLAKISPRWVYVYVAKRAGRTTHEIKNVLSIGTQRVGQILGKAQIKIRIIEKVVGKAVLEAFLDRHAGEIMKSLEESIKTEEIMRSLKEYIERGRLESIRNIEHWRAIDDSDAAESPKTTTSLGYLCNAIKSTADRTHLKPVTSFFYILDGYDVFERFN